MSGSELVPVASIRPHPRNPRRGNLPVITESLRVLGQYRPLLVHRPTKTILAGNNTYKAIKALGWSNVTVEWTDCDEQEALEILLGDNNAADAGHLDQGAVFSIASSLPSLEGTGYCEEDLRMPDLDLVAYDPPADAEPAEKPGPEEARVQPYLFRVGRARGVVDRDTFDAWRTGFAKTNSRAVGEVLALLGLVVPDTGPGERSAITEGEKVAMSELRPYPGNPNQGDIGLLTRLLTEHGQTRSVVVSRRTNRILVGNNLAKAADLLGWTELFVAWVDVDSDTEKRILLVDNRSSQLGSWSTGDLGSLLAGMGPKGVQSSGFTLADLDDILAGNQLKPGGYTKAQTKLVIGPLKADISTELLADLNLTPGQELAEVAMLINLPPEKVAQLPA